MQTARSWCPDFMTSFRYAVHGMVINSPFALHAPIVAEEGFVDVILRKCSMPFERDFDSAELLRDSRNDDGSLWAQIWRKDGAYILLFPGVAEFLINAQLDEVVFVWTDPSQADVGILLVEGTVLAMVAALRGDCLLHASAVELPDGRALVIAGPSGAGKSTLATLLAIAGCRLIADDAVALRVRPHGQVTVSSGIQAARLRESAWDLAALMEGADRAKSVDDRVVLTTNPQRAGTFEVAAIWIPQPEHDVEGVLISHLNPIEAFREILPNLRVLLDDATYHKVVFRQVADLVGQVPVCVATVCWGPPWHEQTISQLRTIASGL